MDRYGFLAESVTPPREDIIKKIDMTHMHLDEVEKASDMVIITHSLLANMTAMMQKGEALSLVDEFIIEGTLDALDEAVESVAVPDDTPAHAAFEVYTAALEARYRGQGFVQGHVEALRVASHLLLEAHRSIFESDDSLAFYATRSVQVLNGLQRAYSIATPDQA